MELSGKEGDMPIPISSTYGGENGHGHRHMIHHGPSPPHNHIMPSSALHMPSNNGHIRVVKYRECLKNHAVGIGGNATDGCGEFTSSGEEGTLEALTCSACNCHRNFHRKEVEGESSYDIYHSTHPNKVGRKVILGHQKSGLGPETLGNSKGHHLIRSRAAAATVPRQMIMPYMCYDPSESDELEDGGGFAVRPPQLVKKRFRTKFTREQKEKMLNFAEKVEWKIQKQEENVVQQFCQEIGLKRRVLKVWMHNNKRNLAKKNPSTAQNQV